VVDIVVTGLSANSVPYIEALERQRALHADVVAGRAQDTVILLEHPGVYTAGRRTEPEDRPSDGTPVIDVDRGGRITWHGPGQLVGYPIVRLPEPLDVVAHVRRLEDALLGLLSDLGIDGRRIDGRSGVWVRGTAPDGSPRDEKVAAVGVRVAERVTMHGFALNCSNALDAYDRIVPCGIRDAGVTTISRVLGRTVTPADVVPLLRPHLVRALDPIGSAMTSTALLSPAAGYRA